MMHPGEIAELDPAALSDEFRAKANGAWILHELTQAQAAGDSLDFFVLFSSAACVWGSRGLAGYAAANHFLDALAHHRAGRNLPALSINWGWWSGDGIAPDAMVSLFAGAGLKGLQPEPALAALEYLLESGAVQKTVVDVDWSVFKPVYESKRLRPLVAEVGLQAQDSRDTSGEAGAADAASDADRPARENLLERIREADPRDRRALVLQHVRSAVAQVLGFSAADPIDPEQGFFKMGMDSIMSVQLRNRLEKSLGSPLPRTVAFEYPSVNALTDFVARDVLKLEAPAVASIAAPNGGNGVPAANGHEELSEEQLLELLARKTEQTA
jgi:myxalamid-type polyketide synthase MxaE and MxaD